MVRKTRFRGERVRCVTACMDFALKENPKTRLFKISVPCDRKYNQLPAMIGQVSYIIWIFLLMKLSSKERRERERILFEDAS